MTLPIISPIFRMAMRVVSFVVWAVTILAAFGPKFNPDHFTIPAILALALPYLAILSAILIIFWALSQKFVMTALGVLALVAIAAPLKLAFPLGSSKNPEPGQQTFKIISWNVLHTADVRKPDYPGNRAVEFMLNSDADIICLAELNNFSPQELKNASPQLIDSLIRKYPYRAGLPSTDIKVISKYPVFRTGVSGASEYGEQRFEFFKVRLPGKTLNVGMVHLYSYDLSPEERKVVSEMKSVDGAKASVKEFKGSILSKLRNAFKRRAENARALRQAIDTIRGPLIVCGDFNDVAPSWTYNLVRGDDMRDAFVETNLGPRNTYNLHGFYFHIDQMLYRGPLEALRLKVGSINCSDHYPLIATFAISE